MNQFDAGTFDGEYQTPEGQKMWMLLNRADVVARMETASDLGYPALAAVEDILLEELGRLMMDDRYKQMAGRMVKHVLEPRDYEHEISGIRINSIPFYKASRYRRRGQIGLYVFKNSKEPRLFCLSDKRKKESLPEPEDGRWIYVNYFTSRLKTQIGFGFDLAEMVPIVRERGYHLHRSQRVLRAPRTS